MKAPKAPELQALEIADMPTEYVLQLDDGTLLTVPFGAWGDASMSRKNFDTTLDRYSWFITRPLISVWQHRHGNHV